MAWVRTFLILIVASTLVDLTAWHQISIPLIPQEIPLWAVLRACISVISLCWILRVRCWVPPSTRQKIQDLGRDEAYNEIYDIARRASKH
jgi:hypothetical protein